MPLLLTLLRRITVIAVALLGWGPIALLRWVGRMAAVWVVALALIVVTVTALVVLLLGLKRLASWSAIWTLWAH